MKQIHINSIENYYNSNEYNIFLSLYLRHLDSEDTIKRLSSLKLNKILDVYNYVYIHFSNTNYEYYSYKSLSMMNIVKELKIKNQLVTFILKMFVEINVIKEQPFQKNNKIQSRKYQLVDNNKEIIIEKEEKIKITFDDELFIFIKKQYGNLRQQKSRALKNNQCIKKIERKISKLKNYIDVFKIFNVDGGITKSKFNEKQITNGRLSHYFISINKEYRQFILLNNGKTESIDFSNSQPTFLANELIKNKDYNKFEDVKLFYTLCTEGKIYEYIATTLKITRDEAKSLWMKIAYGLPYQQHLSNDESTTMNRKSKDFYNIFPNVTLFVDIMKNVNIKDNGLFANYLCKLEADVVNPISKLLTENNIENETIYDEFIFNKNKKEEAINIISTYLKENNININMKMNDDIEIVIPNETKEESNMINQEEKESSLEETKTKELITIKEYEEFLKDVEWYKLVSTNKIFKDNKRGIFDMLFEKQKHSPTKIKELITEYINKK